MHAPYTSSMARRADGELELEVLLVLWNAANPLTAAEVRVELSNALAYTSVATVLTRLCEKGVVKRRSYGRAFRYQPTISREDWYARRMTAILSEAPNHRALLAGFVGKLSKRDLAELRKLLDDGYA